MPLPYPRPTDQERKWLEITRPEADSYLNANDPNVLYIRDIRVKLNRAASEAKNIGCETLATSIDYLKNTYGIQLSVSNDGVNLCTTYEIVDEQKYLIFMMKF